MGRLLRQHGVRGAAAQAAHFAARERRNAVRDPSAGLFQTHTFGPLDSFDSTAVFPDTERPLTVAVDVQLTDVNANGVVFATGGLTWGAAFALDITNSRLILAAGDGRGGNAGVTALFTGFDFAVRLHRFVFAFSPGRRTANLWWDGRLVAAAISAVDPFELHDGDGGAFARINADVSLRLSAEASFDLTDAAIVGRPRCYYGQVPRQMQNAGKGTNTGLGEWSSA